MSDKKNTDLSPAEVQEHLEGVDYPVEKQDLIRHAQDQNAPEEVMKVLRRIPEQQYDSPVDVSKALGDIL